VSDSLAAAEVVPRLRGRFGRPYVYAERCPSTQRALAADAPEGAVAVAEEQTEGRGRLARRWVVPPRAGILFSLVLRPARPQAEWPGLMLVAAHAVADAIAAVTALAPTVKHPNDVLVGGRKVAGILAEATDGRVVLGVGLNVNLARGDIPAEVQATATSLLLETGRPADRRELLVEMLERIERAYDVWLGLGARASRR
jgi:BirA family transcriptional regulator, biotin operon repressor / biotin---[acetyl-CoA-carboxylase] ligase